AQVLCLVVLSGFTPAPCESDALQPAYLLCGFGAVWVCVWLCELVALELVDELDEDVDDEEDDVSAFFSCPGGVPCGFPASAGAQRGRPVKGSVPVRADAPRTPLAGAGLAGVRTVARAPRTPLCAGAVEDDGVAAVAGAAGEEAVAPAVPAVDGAVDGAAA